MRSQEKILIADTETGQSSGGSAQGGHICCNNIDASYLVHHSVIVELFIGEYQDKISHHVS